MYRIQAMCVFVANAKSTRYRVTEENNSKAVLNKPCLQVLLQHLNIGDQNPQ